MHYGDYNVKDKKLCYKTNITINFRKYHNSSWKQFWRYKDINQTKKLFAGWFVLLWYIHNRALLHTAVNTAEPHVPVCCCINNRGLCYVNVVSERWVSSPLWGPYWNVQILFSCCPLSPWRSPECGPPHSPTLRMFSRCYACNITTLIKPTANNRQVFFKNLFKPDCAQQLTYNIYLLSLWECEIFERITENVDL